MTSAPGLTQMGLMGIAANCNKYASAISGDSCDAFAARNEITDNELYAWNNVLGVNGENCGNSLWADEYYCVGVEPVASSTKTTSPTSTSAKVTAPGPTQTGIVANCTKFAAPDAGTGCYDFAAANGITTAQLYQWNPVLGATGENCGTSFWTGEYYCVGVSD